MKEKTWTKLWLDYRKRRECGNAAYFSNVWMDGFDRTREITANALVELKDGISGMLGMAVEEKGNDMAAGKAAEPEIIWSLKTDETSVTENNEKGLLLQKVFTWTGQPAGEDALSEIEPEGFALTEEDGLLILRAVDEKGMLYGVFHLLRLVGMERPLKGIRLLQNPSAPLRMYNHWDNMDGSIERGYSGRSFFFQEDSIIVDERTRDYARLAASIGINGVVINNVNVKGAATYLITERYFEPLKKLANLFAGYGIRLFLSLNFAAPMELGGPDSADPLEPAVISWWREKMEEVFTHIPNLGGFLVKADSEGRPGPFTYGRTQADGANMLADLAALYGGIIIWRCFVYNCTQDWRDKKTDRARAGYDNFMPMDGEYHENVILQIKNGPMDFQIREPVSPLIGGLKKTNRMLEVQVAQEYTGQQIDVCYLVPMFKEILDFHTCGQGGHDTVADIISGRYGNGAEVGGRNDGVAGGMAGSAEAGGQNDGIAGGMAGSAETGGQNDGMAGGMTGSVEAGSRNGNAEADTESSVQCRNPYTGIAAVCNTGNDANWTGSELAAANFYGFGRLAFENGLSAEEIAREWALLTLSNDEMVVEKVLRILLPSREVYEKYTSPLGIGWMVAPATHYGCSVDGYEYSRWGTYHRADHLGIGVDRTKQGTGYTGQYPEPLASMYESMDTCPEELLLFFHHVPYTHRLRSGKTLIQHIYDSHFEGAEEAGQMAALWEELHGRIPEDIFLSVKDRFVRQLENVREWRDQVNSYFYRKSGIPDENGREIF